MNGIKMSFTVGNPNGWPQYIDIQGTYKTQTGWRRKSAKTVPIWLHQYGKVPCPNIKQAAFLDALSDFKLDQLSNCDFIFLVACLQHPQTLHSCVF